MSLSNTTLALIQKAGAAAFAADVKLKSAVKDYSERVNAAMSSNPDSAKNDALFANWKIVSRLSQALASIEEELKKLFQVASSLTGDVPTASAPVAVASAKRAAGKTAKTKKEATSKAPASKTSKPLARQAKNKAKVIAPAVVDVAAPAEVVVSTKAPAKAKAKAQAKAPSKAKAQSAPKAKPVSKKAVAKISGPAKLGANPTKVLRHLETLLNANDFTVISQTAVSKETGIPLGSMTAATKKLLETGYLVAGPSGSFKLTAAQPNAAQ